MTEGIAWLVEQAFVAHGVSIEMTIIIMHECTGGYKSMCKDNPFAQAVTMADWHVHLPSRSDKREPVWRHKLWTKLARRTTGPTESTISATGVVRPEEKN
jgi:hypothetical protein